MILMKMFVIFFCSLAPKSVDLTIKTIKKTTAKNMKINLTMFKTLSGHVAHLKSPCLEYPTAQSAQIIP